VVRHPLARAVFLAYFLLLLAQRLPLPFIALWVEQLNGPVGLATVVGLVAGGYGLASAIGSPLGGLLGDRVGYRRVFVSGVLLVAACLGLIAVSSGLLPFAIAYAAYGVGFATAGSMLFTLLATGLPPEIRSPVLNLALVPLYVSGVIGSLLSTVLLAGTGGDMRPLWAIAAFVALLAIVPAVLAMGRGSSADAGERSSTDQGTR
jgi:DHA1 family multidrug resistance protein-like MFS transporter